MRKLWIVPIEPIETRYSAHWYTHVFDLIDENVDNFDVRQIQSQLTVPENTPGAFFNFEFTTRYKNDQMQIISQFFDEVEDGDVFLFMDYWNPCVIQLKYMAAMSKKNIQVVGVCHAGLWDPADLLSQNFADQEFGHSTEATLYDCFDHLIFATEFSMKLYSDYMIGIREPIYKGTVTGFPMEYFENICPRNLLIEKENIVLFPHRNAPEKHPELFDSLSVMLPKYKFIKTLDVCKSKDDYHDLMAKAKVCISFADQETLGISMGQESLHFGCYPLVPDRLSYSEIFKDSEFLYPDGQPLSDIANRVVDAIERFDDHKESIEAQRIRNQHWFNGKRFYEFLRNI